MNMSECVYCKHLQISFKAPDKDDRKSSVCVTVENQFQASPIQQKELVVRLTDDDDLYFLYSLHLSEEDFQHLKIQQGLLVDFGAFPQKFVDLLELCHAEESKASPRYVLQFVGSRDRNLESWTLNVIETNPFKHLTHLSLKFIPGTDRDVKDYLANCLKNVLIEKKTLSSDYDTTKNSLTKMLNDTQKALTERTRDFDQLKTEWRARSDELSNKFSQQITMEKEKTLETQTYYQQKFEKEKRELESAHLQIVKQLEGRMYDFETSNKCLSEDNFKLEAQLREARGKLEAIETEYQEGKRTIQSLRREMEAIDKASHERECQVHRLETRVAVLEQEKANREEMLGKSRELAQAEAEQRALLQEENARRGRHVEKLERSVKTLTDELSKGNEIIKKLQSEVRSYHAKVKLRGQIASEQERVIGDKDAEVAKLKEEIKNQKNLIGNKEEEVSKLNEQLEGTREKLNEARQLLKTNENVIQWLNKQVTENQLQKHRKFEPPPPANPTYRPPTILPQTSAAVSKPILGPGISNASTLAQMAAKYSSLPQPVGKSTPLHTVASPLTVDESAANGGKESRFGLDTKYFQKTDVLPVRQASAPSPLGLTDGRPPTSSYFPGVSTTDVAST